MAKRKIVKYYPFTAIGGFYEYEYLEILADEHRLNIENYVDKVLTSFDYSNTPAYIKELLTIDNEQMVYNDSEDGDAQLEGVWMGVPVLMIPEHISPKRAAIDIREFMISCGLLPKDAHPDSITLFSRVVCDKD